MGAAGTPVRLLFVCVQNAGRSQMAAGFARLLGGSSVIAESAGSRPAEAIHPNVAAAMREVGVDLTAARPEPITDERAEHADVVVTMGCGDACPVIPGKRYVDWDIEDPAGLSLAETRRVRGHVRLHVEALLHQLGVGPR